jgi:hypothetical protein
MAVFIKKLSEINERGKPLILFFITVYVIYLNYLLSVFTEFHKYISAGIYLISFIAWVYRFTMYDLRNENLPSLKVEQKIYFIIFTLVSFLLLNFIFFGEDIDFLYVLLVIISFSFVMWIIFIFVDKVILGRTEVRFYYGIILLSSLLIAGINFYMKR